VSIAKWVTNEKPVAVLWIHNVVRNCSPNMYRLDLLKAYPSEA